MEQILYLYELDYDPDYPLICFDERPCQLIDDVLQPIPMKPGQVKRQDYQYERKGTCCLLVAFEPLTGQRILEVSKHRKQADYTRFMSRLAQIYNDAKQIILIQDNLNTHQAGSFYQCLPAQQAFDLTQRYRFYYTPKKASWLNMVEIELSVISKQCLDRRIPSMDILAREVGQLVKERNEQRATVNWQFTNQKARAKFDRHYKLLSNNL